MIYILRFILTTIIIFFVWNILKRLFFTVFYKKVSKIPKERKFEEDDELKKNISSKIKWDAETIDYEEIKEDSWKKE